MAPSSTSVMVPLEHLLDQIDRGSVAIPDFQRPFVWTQQQIESLLATVLNGWPSGSLLMLRGDTDMFRVRELEGTPPLSRVEQVVLDGQQRLTALYWALRDAGSDVFALDISEPVEELVEAGAIEDRVVTFPRDQWLKTANSPGIQARRRLLPLHVLQTPSEFFEWRDAAVRELDEPEASRFLKTITELYRERLSNVHRYAFPVVTLEPSTEAAAIARVFEKVNRSGTVLGTFDLMVARVYEPGWNLRDHWDFLKDDDPLLEYLTQDDGMPLLEAMALRHRGSVRRETVLNLDPHLVRSEWAQTASAAGDALRRLARDFGVREPSWLPYRVMLVALTALHGDTNPPGRELIANWFWRKSFGLGYDAAANTRIASDFASLRTGALDLEESGLAISESLMLNSTRRSHRALLASLACLLAARDATDLGGANFREVWPVSDLPGLDSAGSRRYVASIFPRGLEVGRFEAPPHLRTVGMVFANGATRKRLRDGGIQLLVRSLLDEIGETALNLNLHSQLLPSSAEILDLGSDWRGLAQARFEMLAAVLSADWGIQIERQSTA